MPLDFLRLLWDGLPKDFKGLIGLFTLPDRRSEHLPVGNLEAVSALALAKDSLDSQVYFGCGLRGPATPPAGRGGKADVVALPGFWLDVDITGPAHRGDGLPPAMEDAFRLLEALPLPPTAVVDSGHGLHAWWLFPEPLVLAEFDGGWREADKVSKAWQRLCIAKGAELGWRIDDTADIARILRLPGTTNRKVSGDPRPVRLLLADGPRFPLADFRRAAVRPVGRPSGVAQAFVPTRALLQEELPDPVPVDLVALALKLEGLASAQDPKPGLPELVAGQSIAPPNERDNRLQSLCSLVAFICPEGAPEQLAQVFEPTIGIWAAEPDAKLSIEEERAKVVDKLSRARPAAVAERRRLDAVKEGMRRSIVRGKEASPGAPFADGDDPQRLWSEDEVAAFAASQGVAPGEFKRLWIVQKGLVYFLWRGDPAWSWPVQVSELHVAILEHLARAPIDWFQVSKDGSLRPRPLPKLIEAYGTVARELVADVSAQESRWDPKERVFVEATCPIRALEPLEDRRIDTWLRLLGGPSAEKLLDWIATVACLDKQTCALYLSGPAGAGKTMLAHGLARLWHRGGPTELGTVLDGFNADLARCPLLLADEELPIPRRGTYTATLRRLLGDSDRTLQRKFMPNATLKGALRLILCANNDRMLLGDEDLSAEDLAAVAERYFHIEVPREAKEYLASIGGRAATDGWVDGDLIARHTLWLAETREVRSGNRFIVEGHLSSMHRKLATQGRVVSLVCEAIAKQLDRRTVSVEPKLDGLFLVGDGKLLVNVNAIPTLWKQHIHSDDKLPGTPTLGRALRNISRGEVRAGKSGPRFHDVDLEQVIDRASDMQIGDAEAMRAKVATPFKLMEMH